MVKSLEARSSVNERSESIDEANFARFERYEHLRALARVTLWGTPLTVFLLAPVLAIFAYVLFPDPNGPGGAALPASGDLIPAILLSLFSYLTLYLFNKKEVAYEHATALYIGGLIVSIGAAMLFGAPVTRLVAPFAMILVVSIAGLLMGPRHALIFTGIGTGVISILTFVWGGSVYDFVALFLVILAAGVVRVTSSNLYRAIDWAMVSYRRSEERADALWRSREELRKSLAARNWLNEQLRMANTSLEEARESAEEANRLKTQFVANMSHELRTPLNAIINFTRIVMEGYAGGEVNEEQRAYLEYVRFAGEHLLGLINDILDLAKIEAGRVEIYPEPLDLGPIFKGVMSTAVGLTRDKGLSLKEDVADDLPKVYADSKRVRQILLNLLSNAAKFTESGGIVLHADVDDQVVRVAVEDTGIGISPEDHDKVFEEFRQVDQKYARSAEGTGLGIPISKMLVEMHGGRMWLESEVGGGSTFYITLPVFDLARHGEEGVDEGDR